MDARRLPSAAKLVIGTAAVAIAAAIAGIYTTLRNAKVIRHCAVPPGDALVLFRVERDTALPFPPGAHDPVAGSHRRRRAGDSLRAFPGTPLPAARVRVLQLDSFTRAAFARGGVAAEQPTAYIRAAPFGPGCVTARWTDSLPWVERDEIGFARATLADRGNWVDGAPVLVVLATWRYPYPRRVALASGDRATGRLAPAEALFGLEHAIEGPMVGRLTHFEGGPDTARRARVLAWAREHPTVAELEPVRSMVRREVLASQQRALEHAPSRLRGTYRVGLETEDVRRAWYFRTYERPLFAWTEAESTRTTADLVASPYPAGYMLAGPPAKSREALADAARRPVRVWLAAADRPLAPGNETRRAMRGELRFVVSLAPRSLWDLLGAFVPPRGRAGSARLPRSGRRIPLGARQTRLPLTLRLDAVGGVRADTTLVVRGRRLRLTLDRVDTTAMR